MNILRCFRPLPSLFIALCLLLPSAPAPACVWTYGTGLSGEDVAIDAAQSLEDAVSSYMGRLERAAWRHEEILADSIELADRLAGRGSRNEPDEDHREEYELRNDYAVTFLRLGHFRDALAMLHLLERDHPGLYATASNIGTAYELLGRNDSALHWIREGMRRNPDSHYGSEWLHVRILETKIAMERDPDWLRHHTVLGLDFGRQPIPDTPSVPSGHPLAEEAFYHTGLNIFYQLSERLFFTPRPDPLAASLLVDLGNILVLGEEALQIAVQVYELALKYDPPDPDLIRRRIAALNTIIEENPPSCDPDEHFWRHEGPVIVAVAGGILLLFAGLVMWGIWWWKRRKGTRKTEENVPDAV